MARGKNSRRNSQTSTLPLPTNRSCACGNCNGISCLSQPSSFGHKNPKDVQDAIDFHWKILPIEIKMFLLRDPVKLCLRKFVDFYSTQEQIENTSKNVAASICGCSWYLALQYMFLGKLSEAKALILNAAFLQEVYNVSIGWCFDVSVLYICKSVANQYI